MSKNSGSFKKMFESFFATGAILIAFLFAYYLYSSIMGSPVNFEGGNPKGTPLPGNYMGMLYKGGPIVPILMTCILTLLHFHRRKSYYFGKSKRVKAVWTHLLLTSRV